MTSAQAEQHLTDLADQLAQWRQLGCREPFVQNFRQDAYPSCTVSAGDNRSSATIGRGT